MVDYTRGFSVKRELHPSLICDPKFGFRGTVKDPNRLNKVVVFYRAGEPRIGAETTDPGAILKQ